MGGDPAELGRLPVYAAGTFVVLDMHALRAPALDPVAKLEWSDGDNQRFLIVAVELFAVAPFKFGSVRSQAP